MKKLFFLWVVMGLLNLGFAQNSQTLSLSDCIRYAEQHSLTLQTANLSKEMSEISLRQSKLNLSPTISASASQGMSHSIGDGFSLSGNYGINMGMSLFDGLYNYNAIKQSKLSVEQSELQWEKSFNQLKISIIQNYLSILMNYEMLDYQTMVLETSREQFEQGKQQFKVGQILESDFLMLQSQYNSDSLNIENTKITISNQYVTLRNLLVMDPQVSLQLAIPDSVSLLRQLMLPELSEVLSKTMGYLPDIKMDSNSVKLAQYDVKLAQSSYYPSLSLSAGASTGWSWLAQNNPTNVGTQLKNRFGESVGLNLNIPIYSRHNVKSNVDMKKLSVQQAELQLKQTQINVRQEIESYYHTLKTSLNKFNISEVQKNAYFANYMAYTQQFKYGSITAADLLQQQSNYLNVLNNYMQNKYSFLLERKILDVYMGEEISL